MEYIKNFNPNDFSHLRNKTFIKSRFEQWSDSWDHEHCQFCWKSNSQFNSIPGYYTLDKYYWVCEECFSDYNDVLNLRVEDKNSCYNDILNLVNIEVGPIQDTKCYNIRRVKNLFEELKATKVDFHSTVDVMVRPAIVDIYPNPQRKPIYRILQDGSYEIHDNNIMKFIDAVICCESILKQLSITENKSFICIYEVNAI